MNIEIKEYVGYDSKKLHNLVMTYVNEWFVESSKESEYNDFGFGSKTTDFVVGIFDSGNPHESIFKIHTNHDKIVVYFDIAPIYNKSFSRDFSIRQVVRFELNNVKRIIDESIASAYNYSDSTVLLVKSYIDSNY